MQKLERVIVTAKSMITFIIAVSIVSIGLAASAEDLQKFTVKSNDTVIAIVSERELSRFIFAEDKIKQIFAINGELNYEVVDENLYIRPSIHKPVNFFVSTEKGNTYKIIATPKDIPATQISITTKESVKEVNDTLHVNKGITGESIFRHKISKVIRAAKAGDSTVGYEVNKIGKSSRRNVIESVTSYFDSIWSNNELEAEKHIIRNESNRNIKIDKRCYLTGNFDAVYLASSYLSPGETTVIIKVRVVG